MKTEESSNSSSKTALEWGEKKEWSALLLFIFLAGFLANLATLFKLETAWYLPRNLGTIVFLPLLLYVLWRQNTPKKQALIALSILLSGTLFLNLLPGTEQEAPFLLACLHMPVVFWSAYAYASLGNNWSSNLKRVDLLRTNGDLLLLVGLICLGGILFSALTVGLFKMIQMDVAPFYFEKIAPWGLASVPVLALFLLQHNKTLVQKISPLIATLFTPFALLTLLLFSSTLPFASLTVFEDREFLLVFDLILLAILALILFSLSDPKKQTKKKVWLFLLFGLAIVALVDNLVVLTAIGFRMAEFGLSPNRLAVLGLNFIMFLHLGAITSAILQTLRTKSHFERIEVKIGQFLPFYSLWAAFVALIFPLLF